MNYAKPEVVTLGAAAEAIRSDSAKQAFTGTDVYEPSNPLQRLAAYEADE